MTPCECFTSWKMSKRLKPPFLSDQERAAYFQGSVRVSERLGAVPPTLDPTGASLPLKDEKGQNREPLKEYLRWPRQWKYPGNRRPGMKPICTPVESQDLPQDQGSKQEEPPTQVRPLGLRQIASRPRIDSDTLRRESTKIHRLRRRIDATEGSARTKADAIQMHQTSKGNNFDEDRELN